MGNGDENAGNRERGECWERGNVTNEVEKHGIRVGMQGIGTSM